MYAEADHVERPIERLYRAALGDAAAGPYLAVFARFDDQGQSGAAWNNAAAVFHLGWLAHHRLWAAAAWWALLAAALGLMVAGLWQLAAGWSFGVKLGLSLALGLVGLLVPGLWGTAWLHGQLRQRMIAAVERAPTVDLACEALQAEARQRQRHNTWGLALLSAGVVLAGLLTWIAPWRSLAPIPSTPVASMDAPTPSTPSTPAAPATDATGPQAVAVAVADDGGSAAAAAAVLPETADLPPSPPGVTPSLPLSPAPDAGAGASVQTPEPLPAASDGVRTRVQGHGVAVGMFAVEANAERVVAQLRAAGLPVLSDPVASARGTLTRVRVGPFEQREQAGAAARQVQALGLDAKVYAP